MANQSQRSNVKLKPRYPRLRLLELRREADVRVNSDRPSRTSRVSSANRAKTRH